MKAHRAALKLANMTSTADLQAELEKKLKTGCWGRGKRRAIRNRIKRLEAAIAIKLGGTMSPKSKSGVDQIPPSGRYRRRHPLHFTAERRRQLHVVPASSQAEMRRCPSCRAWTSRFSSWCDRCKEYIGY
jgi:hypothetical protein